MKKLRVAILHDWLTGYRGGERVLETLLDLYPDAPLYTLVHQKNSTTEKIENRDIRTSFLQSLPQGIKKYQYYLPIFPLLAESMRLGSKYDLLLSTSHAVMKSVPTGDAKHWCYIHSPMRYVWDRFDDYFGSEKVGTLASNLLYRPVAKYLRFYDKNTASRVDHFVANSNFVAQRVLDFYNREAEVIFPPVDVDKYSHVQRCPKDHYLFFSALVPYKKTEIAIEACQNLNRKLWVLGGGPELNRLKKIADPNWIQFLPNPTDNDVSKHFSEARAMLFPGVEDFGIVPLEALSAGLPLIGLKKGGLVDSQTDETCQFFTDQSVSGMKQAILDFESRESKFETPKLKAQAKKFSEPLFKKKIQESINRFIEKSFN